jgi:lipopolysaccharide transport system ATP-binding protein
MSPILEKEDGRFLSNGSLLSANKLSKSFSGLPSLKHTIARRIFGQIHPRFVIFENIDFSLLPGEFVSLVGGNGSGKSTFLRCLAGVIQPTQGSIERNGRIASILSHGFGAYEDLPVWRNIVLVLQILGADRIEAKKLVGEVASLAKIEDRLYGPTSQLSEGMRAKISLASLVHCEFDVALLDESLNHVDSEFRQMFLGLTRNWIQKGKSIILTSHDEAMLHSFATRSLTIKNKELIALS